ncbi:MAG: universal stress protein [Gammaproteobacteria bacterium]|nr:universal stress protein [Gammaproteobacteria bacterium]
MTGIKGINSILFIADNAPDERYAFKKTVDFAQKFQARIVIMDVLELSALEGDVIRKVHSIANLQEKLLEVRTKELQDMIAPYLSSGVEMRIKVRIGRLHQEAVQAISRGGHKLLVKSIKGPKNHPQSIGPMDTRLIHHVPCPVLILRKHNPGPVISAVALTSNHGDESLIEDQVFRFGHALADMSQTTLHLAHAWELPDEKILRAVGTENENELLRLRIRESHQYLIDKMMARHPEIIASPHLLEGWASSVIPKLVDELQAGMLILGFNQRNVQGNMTPGSILEVILHLANCSIMIIKS